LVRSEYEIRITTYASQEVPENGRLALPGEDQLVELPSPPL
jgi:hypothetical protein